MTRIRNPLNLAQLQSVCRHLSDLIAEKAKNDAVRA